MIYSYLFHVMYLNITVTEDQLILVRDETLKVATTFQVDKTLRVVPGIRSNGAFRASVALDCASSNV